MRNLPLRSTTVRHLPPLTLLMFILLFSLFVPMQTWAGIEIQCEGTIRSWVLSGYYRTGECSCPTPTSHPVCVTPSGSSKQSPSRSNSGGNSMENDIKQQLFQGVLEGLTQKPKRNSPSQQQQKAQQDEYRQLQMEREQKARALEFARQKDFAEKKGQLLGDLKGVSAGALADVKTLDGDAETMRREAGELFDQSTGSNRKIELSAGTDFFGTALSKPEISTLMEPDTDPVIVDVREAHTFVVQSLKQHEKAIKRMEPPKKEEKKEGVKKPDCGEMIAKYNRQIDDMKKFQKQTEFTKGQFDEWQQKNNAAFWATVVDGASFAFGEFFDYLKETRSGAENIKRNLELIEVRLINEKVYSPAQIARIKMQLNVRMAEYRMVKFSSEFGTVSDYFDYVKNVIQSSAAEIGSTDADIQELLANPKVKEYMGDFPTVDAAQFLVGKSITAFLATKGLAKFSYVGVAQLAVNTAYNVTDLYLSYKNICTLRNAAGKELEAARKIQGQLANSYNAIVACKKQ